MNPRETLIHVTSFGENAVLKGGATHFQNYSKAPMKDINRVGLVHYSIPKFIDHLDESNNTFYIDFRFQLESMDDQKQNEDNQVTVTVNLPCLDYFNVKDASLFDQSDDNQR